MGQLEVLAKAANELSYRLDQAEGQLAKRDATQMPVAKGLGWRDTSIADGSLFPTQQQYQKHLRASESAKTRIRRVLSEGKLAKAAKPPAYFDVGAIGQRMLTHKNPTRVSEYLLRTAINFQERAQEYAQNPNGELDVRLPQMWADVKQLAGRTMNPTVIHAAGAIKAGLEALGFVKGFMAKGYDDYYDLQDRWQSLSPWERREMIDDLESQGIEVMRMADGSIDVIKGEPEFNPDQPRSADGTWSGGGGSGAAGGKPATPKTPRGAPKSPTITSLDAAAKAVKSGDVDAAQRYLREARKFVQAVEKTPPPAEFNWTRTLFTAGGALEAVADVAGLAAVSIGAGAATARLTKPIIGASVAVALASALIYEQWAKRKESKRAYQEATRIRESMGDLERELRRLRDDD